MSTLEQVMRHTVRENKSKWRKTKRKLSKRVNYCIIKTLSNKYFLFTVGILLHIVILRLSN